MGRTDVEEVVSLPYPIDSPARVFTVGKELIILFTIKQSLFNLRSLDGGKSWSQPAQVEYGVKSLPDPKGSLFHPQSFNDPNSLIRLANFQSRSKLSDVYAITEYEGRFVLVEAVQSVLKVGMLTTGEKGVYYEFIGKTKLVDGDKITSLDIASEGERLVAILVQDNELYAARLTLNLTSRAPYYYNLDRFNIYAIYTYSRESYYDNPDDGGDPDGGWGERDTYYGGYRSAPVNQPGNIFLSTSSWVRNEVKEMLFGEPAIETKTGVFILVNTPSHRRIITRPRANGVPLSSHMAMSLAPIHEFLHTTHSGAHFNDHDYHVTWGSNISYDRHLAEGASHNWQHWFVFDGTAPSPQISVTDAFRDDPIASQPYSGDPSVVGYVNALDHFIPGLWEVTGDRRTCDYWNDDTCQSQYSTLLHCGMNSLYFKGDDLCPGCSEEIVRHLVEATGDHFDIDEYQHAEGAYLEFPIRNRAGCTNWGVADEDLDLNGLVEVNGVAIPSSEFETYSARGVRVGEDSINYTRVDLSPYLRDGVAATIAFNPRNRFDPATRLWISGIQLVNGRGARYPMHPIGDDVIHRLSSKSYDSECEYQYWNLSSNDTGDDALTVAFIPHVHP